MEIKSKRMRIFTDKFNYFCKVGGTKVHIFRENSQISVDDLVFSKSIKDFDDLEDIAKMYELKQKMTFKVKKIIDKGVKQDKAIIEVVSDFQELSDRKEDGIIDYILEHTDFY